MLSPTHYPVHDREWLHLADQYEKATGQVVVNPRNLQPRSLTDIDEAWLESRRLWGEHRKYEEDWFKRPAEMQ